MRSGGNNYNYYPENKLTKLVNFVQLIRTCMLSFCLEDWGPGPPGPPLATPLDLDATATNTQSWQVSPGLPWIWNFPSISISISTDFPWISMYICMDIHGKSVDMDMDMDGKFHIHGYIHSHRRLTCVHAASNFCKIQQCKSVYPPPLNVTQIFPTLNY